MCFRIFASLFLYFSPLSHGNQEEDRVIGCKMLFLAKQSNDLKTCIEHEGIEKIKSAEWTRIDAINISFEMTLHSSYKIHNRYALEETCRL
jgi:hypothetical protein